MAQAASTNFYVHIPTNFNTLRCYYFPELSDLVSSQQVIFAFLITSLVNFLQIMYHNKPESPFETHRKTILLAIGSLLMYCLSYMKLRLRVSENHYSRHHHMANYFLQLSMAFFGALSVACLLSILFPEWLCTLLFTLAVLYTLSYLSGFLNRTICNWWRAVTTLLCRQQQQRTLLGSTRLVSAQLPCITEDDINIDQFNLLPV